MTLLLLMSTLMALPSLILFPCYPHNFGFSCSPMTLCCLVRACRVCSGCLYLSPSFAGTVTLLLARRKLRFWCVAGIALCTLKGSLCNLVIFILNVSLHLSTWGCCLMQMHLPSVWLAILLVELGNRLPGSLTMCRNIVGLCLTLGWFYVTYMCVAFYSLGVLSGVRRSSLVHLVTSILCYAHSWSNSGGALRLCWALTSAPTPTCCLLCRAGPPCS